MVNISPKVSIVVLNYNNYFDTLECIESILKITYENYDIIIVDNGSDINIVNDIKLYLNGLNVINKNKIILIENKKNDGYVLGNNIGIKEALKRESRHVLILNNDTKVDIKFLDKIIEVAESDKQIGLVGPRVYFYHLPKKLYFNGARVNWWTGEFVELTRLKSNDPIDVDILSGCCVLLTNTILQMGWLLSPTYGSAYSDIELCLNAKKIGLRIVFVPSSIIWHKFGGYRVKMLKNEPLKYMHLFKPHKNLLVRINLMSKYSNSLQFISQIFFTFFLILPKQIYFISSKMDSASLKMFLVAFFLYLKDILFNKDLKKILINKES